MVINQRFYKAYSEIKFPSFEEGTYVYRFRFFAPNGKGVNSSHILINVDDNGNITGKFFNDEDLTESAE